MLFFFEVDRRHRVLYILTLFFPTRRTSVLYAVSLRAVSKSLTAMTYELTIEPLGASVPIEEGQTFLDAALRAGIYLPHACGHGLCATRSEEHTSELQSLMRNSYAVFCLKKKT